LGEILNFERGSMGADLEKGLIGGFVKDRETMRPSRHGGLLSKLGG